MKNSNIRAGAVALAATALLVLPGAAFAREGAASGGGKKTTPTYSADCGVITATNSPHLFGGRDSGLLAVDVLNCGQYIGSYDIDERGTVTGANPLDPFTTVSCTTATATAGHVTLKAGDDDGLELAALQPFCATPIWGTNGTYDVVYDLTLKDAASGTPLATTQSVIQYRSTLGG